MSTFAELEQRIIGLPEEKSRGDAFEVFAEAYLATQRKHDAETVWPLSSVPGDVLQSLKLATQDYGIDGVLKTRLGNHSAYQVKFRTGRPALTWRELSTFMGLADSPNIHSRILLTNCDELPSVLNDRQGFFCIRGSDLDRLEADDFKAIEAWLADSIYQAPRKTPLPHQIEALEKILPAFKEHNRVSAIMACGTGKTLVALWVAENVARAVGSREATPRKLASYEVAGNAPMNSIRPEGTPDFHRPIRTDSVLGEIPDTSYLANFQCPAGTNDGNQSAAKILVLLPSLALLRQTLHEWLRETSLPSLAYLCVCSDTTVTEGLDALTTAQSDLDFEVSTNIASVRAFLDASFAGTKIIFCTYQSAMVIGNALKAGEIFDLGIFDEAHKTAGSEGRKNAFALEDKNLPIRKRLFVTATPRHYNPHQRDREGESKLVFSMDKPDVYGEQIYRLTFAEAARRGIICGYKVIISVITSEMVTNELLSRGEVQVNGDAVVARQVANQIALRDAVEKYGTRKIFTFHKTVKSAESFVAKGGEGVRTHLPDFKTFHVNGTMPTARREHEMRDFRAAPLAVMSNARCLTEGVDIPAVDMVAFLSPRRSLVDIVQATGRAMRRSPGKTTGYVLVPLYVELAAGETIEAAVTRAEFSEVWDILNSLQEQDDVLAELIRNLGEQKGRGLGFDDSGFANRIDFIGSSLDLEMLRTAVTTRCFESLYASWDVWLGKLKLFKERFGHCNVEAGWEEDPSLASWIDRQRLRQKKGILSDEQIRQLEELGFIWNWQSIKGDETWMKWYLKLNTYKIRFGHCNIETDWNEDAALAGWAGAQRVWRKKGKLNDNQILRLDSIGFVWEWNKAKADETWMKWYRELEDYTKEHGNPHVLRTHTNTKLASWVWIQRQRRKGTFKRNEIVDLMTAEQVSLLNTLGFRWDVLEEKWMENFERLKEFKIKRGHCEVSEEMEHEKKLRTWTIVQRRLQSNGKLDATRKAMLDSIGFNWVSDALDRTWHEIYDQLKQYHAYHSNADVPSRWKQNPKLANWVSSQRERQKAGQMPESRKLLLDALNFTWQSRERCTWEENLANVLAFKEKNGHCNISVSDENLGGFANNMRVQRNNGTLSAERISKLDAIGFGWASTRKMTKDGLSEAWKNRYDELLRYKQKYGDCKVPYNWSENPQLGRWVGQQRNEKNIGRLHPKREELLNSVCFVWNLRPSQASAR